MHNEARHFIIRETKGVQHDGPIDGVRRNKDVLANDVRIRRPQLLEFRQPGVARLVSEVSGKADVIRQRIKPDIVHKALIEGQRNAPAQALLRSRDAQVLPTGAFERVQHVIRAESREDELGMRLDEVTQPGRVLAQFEIPVLLGEFDDLAPFSAKVTVRPALLVRKKLLLAHAVKATVTFLIELPAIVKLLQHGLHHADVLLIRGRGPAVISHIQLAPERDELVRDAGDEFFWRKSGLLRAFLHLLPVLIHAREEIYFPTTEPLITRHDIGQDFFIRMADVRRRIRVINGGGEVVGFQSSRIQVQARKHVGSGRAIPWREFTKTELGRWESFFLWPGAREDILEHTRRTCSGR